MTEIIDTLLNLSVFIFVALLVWLYFKDTPGAPSQEFNADRQRKQD
jgi:hypothetical protein